MRLIKNDMNWVAPPWNRSVEPILTSYNEYKHVKWSISSKDPRRPLVRVSEVVKHAYENHHNKLWDAAARKWERTVGWGMGGGRGGRMELKPAWCKKLKKRKLWTEQGNLARNYAWMSYVKQILLMVKQRINSEV